MEFRLATANDRPFVRRANRLWLEGQTEYGGPLLATPRSLHAHMELFDAYLAGRLAGITGIATEGGTLVGMGMAGAPDGPSRYDTCYESLAWVWLVWVEPAYRHRGVGLQLLNWGFPILREMGFREVLASAVAGNPAGAKLAEGFGARPVETSYLFNL